MNKSNSILKKIKAVILAILPESRVLLFGSRARGDNKINSDYDLLIITKKNFSLRDKLNYRGQINRLLVHEFNSPVDVLLNSEEEINIKKNLPGHIVRWAIKEGVEL